MFSAQQFIYILSCLFVGLDWNWIILPLKFLHVITDFGDEKLTKDKVLVKRKACS